MKSHSKVPVLGLQRANLGGITRQPITRAAQILPRTLVFQGPCLFFPFLHHAPFNIHTLIAAEKMFFFVDMGYRGGSEPPISQTFQISLEDYPV